jgi:uncharacterized OsmC-like protein
MKITLLSEESIRLEGAGGPLTIEAESADQVYSPFHMLASGLAVCTYSILASWATNAKLNPGDLVIEVSWSFAEKPHRVGDIRLTFDWPSLPSERTETAKRVAALCPIHATFHHSPTVAIEAAGAGVPAPEPALAR